MPSEPRLSRAIVLSAGSPRPVSLRRRPCVNYSRERVGRNSPPSRRCSGSMRCWASSEACSTRAFRAGRRQHNMIWRKRSARLARSCSLDAFAGGFVVQSLLALWLFERFDLSLSAASLFFFWSGLLAAFSFPVAASLSITSVCTVEAHEFAENIENFAAAGASVIGLSGDKIEE